MSNLHFNIMTFGFALRDFMLDPKKKLLEAHIQPGFRVLDYGCGTGSYSLIASERVGNGVVYALDNHPLAIARMNRKIVKRRLSNIRTIQSDCDTGLEEASIDVVLFYDILHMLTDPENILHELRRVLKAMGVLSFSDHHMTKEEIISVLTRNGFMLTQKDRRTYSFLKT
ncbi:MAG: class I SAM-dependent methyltransferase [Deltaproteobacteria bacterium]|nr:class I SAM-dependent methyltransferase [Deltaproteobacteria bacterium]